MLVAYRLAGLSALGAHYADLNAIPGQERASYGGRGGWAERALKRSNVTVSSSSAKMLSSATVRPRRRFHHAASRRARVKAMADKQADERGGVTGSIRLGKVVFSLIRLFGQHPPAVIAKPVPGPGVSLTRALSRRESRW
jgi:hypothetical protein